MQKIIIIGVGWEQIPLIKKAKTRGLYVIATTWWDKTRIPADKVYEVDSRDLDQLEKIMILEKPDYILADECDYSMYAVAYLAEKFHLNGPKLKTQTITNNKFLQREYVSKTEVLQPQYKLCWDVEMAKKFAENIGYPVIVKPLDNRGSIGISRISKEEEWNDAWMLAVSHSHSRMCIVEKCINGVVITADGFCDSEKYEFVAASNKEMYTDNKNVAKVVLYPGEFPSELLQTIKRNTELVVEAVGIDYGFVHIEFMIEEGSNAVYLVEVANRGGGVYISNIVLEQITGIDYCSALLDLAMGKHVGVCCNQNYIAKSAVYLLSLHGKIPISQYEDSESVTSSAFYVKAKSMEADVNKDASAGRQGAVIISGQTFRQILDEGRRIEDNYCCETNEYFMLK